MSILTLDISTVKCGVAILSEDGKNILLSDVLFLDPKSSGLTLCKRAKLFENYLLELKKKYDISRVIIEEPLILVAVGAGSSWSTSLLQRFNGICSFIVYSLFNLEPELVNVNRARSSIGIKFKKGMTKKEKKDFVVEFMKNRFGEQFKTEKTKFGNYKIGVDDRSDALVLALFALQFP